MAPWPVIEHKELIIVDGEDLIGSGVVYGGGLVTFFNTLVEYHSEVQLIVSVLVGTCVVVRLLYDLTRKKG